MPAIHLICPTLVIIAVRRSSTAGTAALPGVPPVRPVSPADVRRTASGRIVKQRSEAALQPPWVQYDKVHALDDNLQAPEYAQQEGKAARILQPCCSPAAVQQRGKLQYLPSFKSKSTTDTQLPCQLTVQPPCKSILEASARRLEIHKRAGSDSSLASQSATVQLFSDAYLSAVTAGDEHWANAANIAALFTPDVMLKTQDKQTFYGKAAALRRLNTGVGMLAKMLGSGMAASLPKPTVKGPDKVDTTTWMMVYGFKQGVMKYSIKCQYTFVGNKIASIQFSRV